MYLCISHPFIHPSIHSSRWIWCELHNSGDNTTTPNNYVIEISLNAWAPLSKSDPRGNSPKPYPLPLFHDHWSCVWDLDGLVNQELYLTFGSALSSPWQSGTTPTLLLTPSQSDSTHDTISYQLWKTSQDTWEPTGVNPNIYIPFISFMYKNTEVW